MKTSPSPRERHLAALAWFRGPITALVVSKLETDSPFVAFQTRQAARFYTVAFVAALIVEVLLFPFLLLLLLVMEFLLVLAWIGGSPDLVGGGDLSVMLAGLLLSAFLVTAIAMIPAVLILGGAHLVGLIAAVPVWRGRNVRLPFFARWAERRTM